MHVVETLVVTVHSCKFYIWMKIEPSQWHRDSNKTFSHFDNSIAWNVSVLYFLFFVNFAVSLTRKVKNRVNIYVFYEPKLLFYKFSIDLETRFSLCYFLIDVCSFLFFFFSRNQKKKKKIIFPNTFYFDEIFYFISFIRLLKLIRMH